MILKCIDELVSTKKLSADLINEMSNVANSFSFKPLKTADEMYKKYGCNKSIIHFIDSWCKAYYKEKFDVENYWDLRNKASLCRCKIYTDIAIKHNVDPALYYDILSALRGIHPTIMQRISVALFKYMYLCSKDISVDDSNYGYLVEIDKAMSDKFIPDYWFEMPFI